jgi:hypothetical protein
MIFCGIVFIVFTVGFAAAIAAIVTDKDVVSFRRKLKFNRELRRMNAAAAEKVEEMFASVRAAAAATAAEDLIRKETADILLCLRKSLSKLRRKVSQLYLAQSKGLRKSQRDQLEREMWHVVNSIFSVFDQENRHGK